MTINRRSLLALAAAALPASGSGLAALDYGLAQTALALGAELSGLPDPADYRAWVITPTLGPAVRDLGARTQPNLEVLRALRPVAILAIADHRPILPQLRAVAPVLELPIYTPARNPWQRSVAAARAIGAALGDPEAADRLVATTEARFAEGSAALAARAQRPLLLASLADPRNLLVYGAGSILHDSLLRLGLRNAWTGETGRWGSALVPLEELAPLGDAALFLIEPLPPDADGVLARSPLWRALPFVRDGRVIRLPPVLMFGTLPAADRFASLLLPHLAGGAAHV